MSATTAWCFPLDPPSFRIPSHITPQPPLEVTYRAEELAQSGRMLTIFALYVSTTGDTSLMLRHFGKARAHAQWLLYRFRNALADYPDPADPRHGIIAGGDEGDTFVGFYETYGKTPLGHKCGSHQCGVDSGLGESVPAFRWPTIDPSAPPTGVEPKFALVDQLQLPAGLKPGHWILGWRWDCE